MVENILVAGTVITAFYFVIRFILKRLAGDSQVTPCKGCNNCNLNPDHVTNGCLDINIEPNGCTKTQNKKQVLNRDREK